MIGRKSQYHIYGVTENRFLTPGIEQKLSVDTPPMIAYVTFNNDYLSASKQTNIMNTIGKLFAALTLVSVVVCSSCKDDDPVGCNWSSELQAELTAFNNAATTYGNNPTTANCNAYRTAGLAYLDAASDLQSCANASGQGTEYAQAIAAAEASLDALVC